MITKLTTTILCTAAIAGTLLLKSFLHKERFYNPQKDHDDKILTSPNPPKIYVKKSRKWWNDYFPEYTTYVIHTEKMPLRTEIHFDESEKKIARFVEKQYYMMSLIKSRKIIFPFLPFCYERTIIKRLLMVPKDIITIEFQL